jgi:hypothetical protein
VGSQGFFGSLGSWLIARFSSESEDTVQDSKKVENDVENLDVINSSRVTVEMCEQAYNRQPYLYQHEIYQPLQDPESLPCADQHQDREGPVDDEDPARAIETVRKAVNKPETAIDQNG